MKKVENGWIVYGGTDLYLEDGKVMRGVINGRTVYPYRWNGKTRVHDNAVGVNFETFKKSDLYSLK